MKHYMEIINEKDQEIKNLKKEISELNETVDWMHDTIWRLMEEKRELSRETVMH